MFLCVSVVTYFENVWRHMKNTAEAEISSVPSPPGPTFPIMQLNSYHRVTGELCLSVPTE